MISLCKRQSENQGAAHQPPTLSLSISKSREKQGVYTGLTGNVFQTIDFYSTNQQPSGTKSRRSTAVFSNVLVEQSGDSACLKSMHWQQHKSTIFSFVKQSVKNLKYKKAVTPNPAAPVTF